VANPPHRLALSHRSADMNGLITLGATAAYGYSLLVTVAPALLPAGVRDVYFEAAGTILTLILLGRLIETRAKAGTGQVIRERRRRPGIGHFAFAPIWGRNGSGSSLTPGNSQLSSSLACSAEAWPDRRKLRR